MRRYTGNGELQRAQPRHSLPRGRTIIGAAGLLVLGLVLGACTSDSPVHTAQATTERELVLAQGPDATAQALSAAYQQMLSDAGIQTKLADPTKDPIAAVLAGKADVAIGGSSAMLGALSAVPQANATAQTTPNGTAADSSPVVPGAPGVLDTGATIKALHALTPKGFAVLDSAAAERTGTLVLTQATSAAGPLVNLAQLGPLCHRLDFGIATKDSAALLALLDQSASCTPQSVTELDDEAASDVLPVIADEVQIQATTVDSAGIPDNALVRLEDTAALFAPQSLTPVITTEGVGQDAIKAINTLSAALKQEDLQDLNRMVTGGDAVDARSAAHDWLTDRSLLVAH